MRTLIRLEWLKIKSYKAFWIILGLYLVSMAALIFGLPGFIDWLAEQTPKSEKVILLAFKKMIFNFPDIWQNIAFVASARFFIKVILGFILVILVTNEFTFNTMRMNIMNGIERSEVLWSKLLVAFFLTLISTMVILFAGIYLGFTNSSNITLKAIVGKTSFIPAYMLEVFTYLTYAIFLSVLIRKTGFAVIAMVLYSFLEPIITYYTPDEYDRFLPMNAINHIIRTPNTSLMKIKTPEMTFDLQEFVKWDDFLVCGLYAGLFILIPYLILKRKDL